MAEIKIGTRVRIGPGTGGYRQSTESGLWPGNTGTVTEVYSSGAFDVYTNNAEEPTDGVGKGWVFFPHEVEVIE